MALSDILSDDMANVFASTDDFGEVVTYTPRGGSPVTYNAQVFRDPPRTANNGDRVPKMVVYLARDPEGTNGPATVNTGGDTITLAYRTGGTEQAYQVAIADQDAGCWVLHIR